MKEIDYDQCYISLGLKPGVSLDEIEIAWKELARFLHPDNFCEGPLKEKGTRKLQDINCARDNLRDYWQKHSKAPPSKLSAAATKQSQPEGRPAQGAGASWPGRSSSGAGANGHRSAGGETAAGAASGRQNDSERETGSGSAFSGAGKAFGPPPIARTWTYDLYDWIFFSHGDAAILTLPVWALIYFGPFLIAYELLELFLIPWLGLSPGLLSGSIWIALSLICGIPFWRMFHADSEIFRIRKSPFLQTISLPAEFAVRKFEEACLGSEFAGRKWSAVAAPPAANGGDSQSLFREFRLQFTEGGRPYVLQLHLRVLKGRSPENCLLSYWFDLEAASDWRVPAAKVLKASDDCLRRLFT